MRKFFILGLVLVTLIANAQEATASTEETAEHLEEINEEEWGNQCREFVDDGELGVYGEYLRTEFMKSGLENIKNGDDDLASICPNYPRMNESDKANVFLIIMAGMAFEESSCNNSAAAKGPNGTAKGFFQLHQGRESHYGPECNNNDSKSPEGSIRCTLSILNKQMGDGDLFRQDSNYWDVLRPQRWSAKRKSYFPNPSYSQIREAIREFEPCYERQSTVQQPRSNEKVFRAMKRIYQKRDPRTYDI